MAEESYWLHLRVSKVAEELNFLTLKVRGHEQLF
jgi:hypothetical protein